jgi:hypothetical protein
MPEQVVKRLTYSLINSALLAGRSQVRFPMVALEFFIDVILLALWSTQYLTEMRTTNRCVGLTTLPLSCADCHGMWEPHSPAILRASPGFTVYCHCGVGL